VTRQTLPSSLPMLVLLNVNVKVGASNHKEASDAKPVRLSR
jgi:hypothetical protein